MNKNSEMGVRRALLLEQTTLEQNVVFLEILQSSLYFSSGVGALSVMYEKGVLNSREEKVFSRMPHQVLYFEVFSRISRVFFFFCQSCLRMVWSLEVYKYWIGPLGELRVARDGPGIRTSSRKLLLADRTCPYNSF